MKFIDYVTITVRSGKGGAGAVAFRREKYEPKGGPAGGDGGQGGSVIMEGDPNLYTLLDLRYNRHHYAEKGQQGGGANKTGRDGTDIVLRVPLGTIARESESERVIGEVLHPGDRVVLARGGRGGKGNAFFKGPTRQTPRFAQPGEPGEERELTLELKLLADVGLVGFPNAGKSTLVSALSAARPKIADYPFTTLEPSLGVVDAGDYRSFVIADLPGIIEQASEGRGLGTRFLKHIERNAVLLFVVPIDAADVRAQYDMLLVELEAFNETLLQKPRMLALSKTDILPDADLSAWLEDVRATLPPDLQVISVSAVARKNLDTLVRALWEHVNAVRSERGYEAFLAEDAEDAENYAGINDGINDDHRLGAGEVDVGIVDAGTASETNADANAASDAASPAEADANADVEADVEVDVEADVEADAAGDADADAAANSGAKAQADRDAQSG